MNPLKNSLDALALSARRRNLVAVVGADLLDVKLAEPGVGVVDTLFYDAVARKVQQDHGLPPEALEGAPGSWMLHRAAAALKASLDSQAKVRQALLAAIIDVRQRVVAMPSLEALAKLSCFDLFVCLTPDDLLASALRAAQPRPVEVLSYAPTESTDRPSGGAAPRLDILSLPEGQEPAAQIQVYHVFGSVASRRAYFSVHEEEALEYLHRFRESAERSAKSLLYELRTRDSAYLGCNLPDWMGRGFVRLLNELPLQEQNRSLDFFCAGTQDSRLSGFLARFSPNSIVFPWEPSEFVLELQALLPAPDAVAAPPPAIPPRARPAAPSVFVSYARDDLDAVRRLVDTLPRVGFGQVWFDQTEIVAGDDWLGRIDEGLARCDYFMPVLSRRADERRVGVFWQEWRRALSHSMKVADAYLLPVGVDDLPPDKMNYRRILKNDTAAFAKFDLLHAPGGSFGPDGENQLRVRLQRDGGGPGA